MARSYQQHCPVAAALDVLGDRWTLLILRELLIGDRRFSDLQRHLPGIAPNLLSDRLRRLEADGLVTQRELPPPAARTVYVLTPAGRQVGPVMRALARFGFDYLPATDPEATARAETAVHAALVPWLDPAAGRAVATHHRVIVDGTVHDLCVRGGRLVPPPPGSEPELTLTTRAAPLLALRQGRTTIADEVASGRLAVDGPPDALERFARLFQLNG